MMKPPGKFVLGCVSGMAVVLAMAWPARAADNALAWPPITSQMQPWAWWWWHGSAVDETNIAHELQRFHDAGLGGVQVTTIYGVKGGRSARDSVSHAGLAGDDGLHGG